MLGARIVMVSYMMPMIAQRQLQYTSTLTRQKDRIAQFARWSRLNDTQSIITSTSGRIMTDGNNHCGGSDRASKDMETKAQGTVVLWMPCSGVARVLMLC